MLSEFINIVLLLVLVFNPGMVNKRPDLEPPAIVARPPAYDLNLCDEKNNNDWCLNKRATEKKDVGLCNKISDSRQKQACQISVYAIKKDMKACQIFKDTKTADSCYLNYAFENLSESACAKILVENTQNSCYTALAVRQKNISFCGKIKSKPGQQDCTSIFSSNVGSDLACQTLPAGEERDNCYRHLAEEKNNLEICDKIYDSYKKTTCIFFVKLNTGNALACEGLTDTSQYVCLYNLAEKKLDEHICSQIAAEYTKNTCVGNVIAKRDGAPGCQKLTGEQAQLCESHIAGSKTNITECQSLQNPNDKDSCVLKIAYAQQNPELCKESSNEGSQAICYAYLPVGENRTDNCKALRAVENQDQCISRMSVILRDGDICHDITNDELENSCVVTQALETKDDAVCSHLPNPNVLYAVDNCYLLFATTHNFNLACEKISNQSFKLACYETIKNQNAQP